MEPLPQNLECEANFTEPLTWILHLTEILLSLLSLTLNCVLAVVTQQAHPIPRVQRRFIASQTLNFSLLAGFQLSRNIFLLFSLYHPCLNLVNTISCKLHEFPLLFFYIHAAVLALIIALQTIGNHKEHHSHVGFGTMCSVWQSAVIVFCIALTLLFTAFDTDTEGVVMTRCSILLALRNNELAFLLLTILICTHAVAVFVVSLRANRLEGKRSRAAFLSYSIKDVTVTETFIWQISLLIAGCLLVYRFLVQDACNACIIVLLEIFFVILPLAIAFAHPVLSIWYVLPMRDAVVKVFPWFGAVLPEYALVPPAPVNDQRPSPRHVTTYMDMTERTPKRTAAPRCPIVINSNIDQM